MVHIIIRDVAVVTDLWCFGSSLRVPSRLEWASPNPCVDRRLLGGERDLGLVGTSRAACCRSRLRVNPFLFWFVSFWLLFSGVWETLIFGTGDWFAFGEPFFCGLFTPTNPLPGHRLVPESQKV